MLHNLYLVDFASKDTNLKTCLFTKITLGWLWHRRLAHVGMSSLKKLMKNDLVRGLRDVEIEKGFTIGKVDTTLFCFLEDQDTSDLLSKS